MWGQSRDKEWPDGENKEICSELIGDDDYDCPYELLKLEEAVRQFDENMRTRLARTNHGTLARPESCKVTPVLETLMWKNESIKRSSVFEVRSGEVIVQRVWVEYDVEINVQMLHMECLERGLIKSAMVRLNNEARATDLDGLSTERMMLSSERCSFSLEVRMELWQRSEETCEVESGKCTTQEVVCVLNLTEELVDLKLECVKQGILDWMCAQKTEAQRLSHGVQPFDVEYEPQWGPRQSAREREQRRSVVQATTPISS